MENTINLEKDKLRNSVYINMTIFLVGKLVSLFGARIMNFAIGLYVLRTTGSGMSFALTMIVSTIPAIILSPFAGVLADRVSRKMVVVVTDVLCGVLLIIVYPLSMRIGLSFNLVLITVFFLSILNTFFNITMETSIPNIVDEKRLTKINSYSSSITSLASIVGPVLGGFIYGFFPIERFLLIAGISFIASAVSEIFINFNFNDAPAIDRTREKVLIEIKSALNYVKTKKVILLILIFAVFVNFVFSSYIVSLPHIINIQLGLSSEQYGLIQSAFAIGSLIFSLIYSLLPERKNGYKYVIYSLMIISALMMLTGIPTLQIFESAFKASLLIYFIIINFSVGGALVFLNLPTFILMQRETSDEYRGRVNGLLGTASLSIQPMGMVLGGLFLDYISGFALVFICGLLFLIISVIFARLDDLKELFL
ncbi:MFS transporter [Kineothrix sp. MB12-C1]|uniref:MFS transporter n=1 Tax=Kineothrix sp. MB12-C1 TaxID=3070215 RepID=UPI0027D2942D|nr:MFS transporter [Kineothrix sp. MB12-C1]WMC93455.1 MFS transporter [Kineothrix sp. MB12-C1]